MKASWAHGCGALQRCRLDIPWRAAGQHTKLSAHALTPPDRQILESSQTLLNVLKRETINLSKKRTINQ
jgi:hypothetical protein